MKRLISLLAALMLVMSLAACSTSDTPDSSSENETSSSSTAPESNDPESSTPENSVPQETEPQVSTPAETTPTETEPVIYEQNLPDEFIISVDDKSVSISGKSAVEIMDTLGLVYDVWGDVIKEDAPNKLYFYGADGNGMLPNLYIGERFSLDGERVILNSISLNYNNDPEIITVLGIQIGYNVEDLFSVFGNPDYTGDDCYKWKNLVIDGMSIESIFVNHANNSVIDVNVQFAKV